MGAFAAAFVLGLVLSAPPGPPDDEGGPVRGSVAIDVQPSDDAPAWLAGALEDHLARELSTYERLTVTRRDSSVHAGCGRNLTCALEGYGARGIDVVLIATAQADALRYELHETWTPSAISRGAIPFDDCLSLIGLRQKLLRVFAPVLSPGGLLDQKPYRTNAGARLTATARTTGAGAPADALRLAVFLAGLAAFFSLPLAAATISVRDLRRLMPARWPATWIAGAAFAAAAVVGAQVLPLPPVVWPAKAEWVLGLIGGAAWGTFVVSNVRLSVPALPGLERVAHRDVFRLIRAWLTVGAIRLGVLSAYYAPFAVATAAASDALGLSTEAAVMLLAPAVGLGARLWLASWIRALTLFLDARLVVGEPHADNPWHREVSRYFRGYLRRTGWGLEPEVLDAILFLPGEREGIRCYGGGAIPARVVIDERVLTMAVGAAEQEDDEQAVFVPEWSAGLMHGPATKPPPSRPARTRAKRGGATSPLARRRDALTTETGHQRKQLGQAATLLGYVRAEPGERVPLIADTVEDLEVVRALLAEHYQWFAPDPDDDDDDTDPTDKDFLFGALTASVGKVIRRDSQVGTLSLALAELASGVPVVRLLHRWLRGLIRWTFGRAPVVVADAYAALHFAGHHHLQYLAYRWGEADVRLTVRAGVDELEHTSARILGRVRQRLRPGGKPSAERARFQRRMVWLSSFLDRPLLDRTERRMRRFATAAVVIAVLAGIGASVYDAVLYHPRYVERIAEQERRLREQREERAAPNEGSPPHGQH